MNTVNALEVCSRLLGHSLGLALAGANDTAMSEDVLRDLGDSAVSVLCKTCLAADTARWRGLRKSSRSLLAAVLPDDSDRAERVDSSYVAEVMRAFVNGGGAWLGPSSGDDGSVSHGGSGDGGVGGRVMSPLLLTRVAQLCRRVCARRSELLRGRLAPKLVGGRRAGGSCANLFVFPTIVRQFWESCVRRRGHGTESMQTVLRCLLHLAVYEMRAAAEASAASSASVKEEGASDARPPTEEDVLRAGLGELMPLLQSTVVPVSQGASAFLATLLGAWPRVSSAQASASTSSSMGRRHGGGVEAFPTQAGAIDADEGGVDAVATEAATIVAAPGSILATYAASADSISEAEGRIETEATSDRGSDSDTDAEGEGRDGGGEVSGGAGGNSSSACPPALAAARSLGDNIRGDEETGIDGNNIEGSEAATGGGGGVPRDTDTSAEQQAAIDRAFSLVAASPMATFDLLPVDSSRKRVRPSSSFDRLSGQGTALSRGGSSDAKAADEGGRADMDVAGEATADQNFQSSAVGASVSSARGGATVVAVAVPPGAAAVGATAGSAAPPGPATAAAAASSKICYRCDGCDDFPLQHVRHHCLVCADFDLCPQCYEVFHGPNSQFQGGNAVMLGGHSTAHGMVTLQVSFP